MQIIAAEVMGFCMGVRRAVESAYKALSEYSNKKVYSLGPLIHNRTVLSELASAGLTVIEENQLEQIEPGSVVIIRAHGVPPAVTKQLSEKDCIVVNATCPRVVASQNTARRYAAKGCTVILAGDKNHGEVTGIAGFAGSNFVLVQDTKQAKAVMGGEHGAVLLSQTTFSPAEFSKIAEVLLQKIPDVRVMNTICPATKERQDALLALCSKVQGVLVIGGKNSANTARLFQTAKSNCAHAALVECSTEIPEHFFTLKTVGITAGASTPDSVIQEIVAALNRSID